MASFLAPAVKNLEIRKQRIPTSIPTSPLYNSALPTIGGVLTREYFMRTWRNKGQGVGDKKQETGDKMQEANDETRDKRQ